MTRIVLKLTAKELDLLSSLVADQLFRREFIDLRVPGFKNDPEGLSLGIKLSQRLRTENDRVKKIPLMRSNGAAA